MCILFVLCAQSGSAQVHKKHTRVILLTFLFQGSWLGQRPHFFADQHEHQHQHAQLLSNMSENQSALMLYHNHHRPGISSTRAMENHIYLDKYINLFHNFKAFVID